MFKNKNVFRAIPLLMATMIAVTPAFANLNTDLDKAVVGQDVRLTTAGDGFHIYPANIVTTAKGKALTGLITHDYTVAKSERITYKIVVKNGEPAQVSYKIDDDQWDTLPNHLGSLIHGNWENSLVTILNTMAAKLELQ